MKLFDIIIAAAILFLVVGLIGWIANIVQVVDRCTDPVTNLFIFKCTGVAFPPLGAVLGYCGMF